MAENVKVRGIGRRGFFGVAVATGAATLTGGALPAVAQESANERTKARYQETDHVRAFYATNRYYKGE
ncbi:MAG: hypothetical protein ACK4GO_01250 [Gemmobacter sp.]